MLFYNINRTMFYKYICWSVKCSIRIALYEAKMSFVVVILWQLDLQLPMESVVISSKVMSSNSIHGDVGSIQLYVIKFVSDFRRVCDFLLFLPPIKLTTVECGVKHHDPNPRQETREHVLAQCNRIIKVIIYILIMMYLHNLGMVIES